MTLLERLATYIKRRVCKHPATIKKIANNRVYRECIDCGFETPGYSMSPSVVEI